MNTNAPYAIIIGLDMNGNVVSFNKSAEDITGLSSSEMMGKNLFDTLSFKDKYPYVLSKFEEWQKGDLKLPLSFENVLYPEPGEERFITWHINEMLSGRDDLPSRGLICCGVDITRLKQYETEISSRNRELLTLKNISEAGLYAQSMEETFQYIADEMSVSAGFPIVTIELYNAAARTMVIKGIAGITGIDAGTEIPAEDTLSGIVARTGRILIEKEPAKNPGFKNEILRKCSMETFLCVPMMKGRKAIGTLSLGHTERIRIDDSLIQWLTVTANHIASLYEKKKTEEELFKAKKLESVGILAGGIAHDFNNLLAVILGNITLLKMYRELDAKIVERLSAAENAAVRSIDLAKKLVTFSRGGTPMKKMTSIVPLIIDAVSTVFHDSRIKNINSIADDLSHVEIDEYQMKQVMNNLLMNAKEAVMLKGKKKGTVTISAVNFTADHDNEFFLTKGDYIRISIEDTGTGIKERDIPNVFDPYFTTKPLSAEKGCGLGLAVSHSIIKKHNGHITVKSREGSGSTFHLFIPACARVTQDIKSQDIQSQKKEMHKADGKRRILVLEDEKSVGDVIEIILSRLGYKAKLAKDGDEAVRLYKNAKEADKPFDAVILDLHIQNGIGGKDAFDALFEYDPQVKAIISSGSPHEPIVANFKEHNFKGALVKPYKVELLDALLKQVLDIRG